MNETIISNEIEETADTLNVDSIEEAVEQMEQESNIESTESTEFNIKSNLVITDEYFEKLLSDMDNMNFIEIKKLNRDMKYQKDSLEKAKDSVEQIIQLENAMNESSETDKNLAAAIAKADVE